ncbi:MAG: hypothetical protein FWB93_00010 [Oscillospiraceae bacterium]|nr:hypothetical protein [Oscillospiraceae bacterium]
MREYIDVLIAEWKRVRVAFAVIVILAVVAPVLLILGEQSRFDDDWGRGGFTAASYRAAWREIGDDPNIGETLQRRYDAVSARIWAGWGWVGEDDDRQLVYEEWELTHFTGELFAEQQLLRFLLRQLDEVNTYSDFLDRVQERAENLQAGSIFGIEDGFGLRNVQRTAEDFARLYQVTPTFDVASGAQMIFGGFGVDWLGLIGLVVFMAVLVLSEKPSAKLLNSAKLGQRTLTVAKVKLTAFFALLLSATLTLVAIGTASIHYGLGDLSRPIQSVFLGAPYIISVGGTILGLFALRFGAYLCWGLLLFFICRKVKNVGSLVAIASLFLATGTLLHAAIASYSYLNIFKYVNPYTLLSPTNLLVSYVNLNLFGQPVNLLASMVGTMAVLAVLLAILLVAKPVSEAKSVKFALFSSKSKPRKFSTRLFIHENWRLYIGAGAVVLLCGMMLVQGARFHYIRPRIAPEEGEFRAVVAYAQGLETEERQEWVAQELELHGYSHSPRAVAIRRLAERLAYLDTQDGGELVYETGWLFAMDEGENLVNAVILAMVLILLAIAVREQTFVALVRSTKHGQVRLTRTKLLTLFGAGSIAYVIAFAPTLWRAVQLFGLDSWSAAALSIPEFAGNAMPLWAVLAVFYAVRLVAVYAICGLVYAISKRGAVFGLVVSVGVFVLPLVLLG